jgi:HAMP domain-containing protein
MRRRLMLAISGVAAAAVVLFALPLALVLRHSYRDEALLRLQRDTIAATRAVDLGRPGGDPVELPPSRDRLAVYDAAGRRVAGHGPATADPATRAALHSARPVDAVQGDRLVTAVPLVVRERVSGVLRAQRSATAAAHAARRAWLLLAALGALLVALAALAALVLGRRLARPLERLAAVARRLGDGDFAARRSGDWLAVDVGDDGPGFAGAGDEFPRRAPSSDGHGIGLSLAQALAHAEGGRLAITVPRPPTVTLWLAAAR